MTNNLKAPGQAEKRKIEDFLKVLRTAGGLDLKSNILACNGQVQPNSSDAAGASSAAALQSPSSSDTGSPIDSKIDSQLDSQISVELTGPDTPLLLARNGELLLAIEHIAAKILRPVDGHYPALFLAEAILISLIGGFAGIVIGLAIPYSVRFLTEYRIPISGYPAIIAIIVSSIVGVVFGTVPATRAAQLDPVESLRYE